MSQFNSFIEKLKSTFPKRVGLCEPQFVGNELKYLQKCIDTGWVSTAGSFVKDFEEKIKEISDCKYAIATNTGTSALHTLYLACGIERGDEVLTPSFTFIATVNAISYCGATPHFVDISEDSTMTVCPNKLKTYLNEIATLKNGQCYNKKSGRPLKALVVMHTFGKATQLDQCKVVCEEYGLLLLEDAAEALGTKYNGKPVGALSDGGVFSFNGNKITTCGGGGVVVTQREDIAEKARHLSTTAKKTHPYLYDHDEVGFNYRMPNLNAAVGLAQLECLSSLLVKKKKLFHFYVELFSDLDFVEVLGDEEWSESNFWLNAVSLKDCTQTMLSEVLEKTNDFHIATRPVWSPIHSLAPYKNCPKAPLQATESKANSIVCLPSSAFLVDQLNL